MNDDLEVNVKLTKEGKITYSTNANPMEAIALLETVKTLMINTTTKAQPTNIKVAQPNLMPLRK